MKTIIKGGKNEFLGHCKWCGCDFRYTSEDVYKTIDDVDVSFVGCPFCNKMLRHYGEHGTSTWSSASGESAGKAIKP